MQHPAPAPQMQQAPAPQESLQRGLYQAQPMQPDMRPAGLSGFSGAPPADGPTQRMMLPQTQEDFASFMQMAPQMKPPAADPYELEMLKAQNRMLLQQMLETGRNSRFDKGEAGKTERLGDTLDHKTGIVELQQEGAGSRAQLRANTMRGIAGMRDSTAREGIASRERIGGERNQIQAEKIAAQGPQNKEAENELKQLTQRLGSIDRSMAELHSRGNPGNPATADLLRQLQQERQSAIQRQGQLRGYVRMRSPQGGFIWASPGKAPELLDQGYSEAPLP